MPLFRVFSRKWCFFLFFILIVIESIKLIFILKPDTPSPSDLRLNSDWFVPKKDDPPAQDDLLAHPSPCGILTRTYQGQLGNQMFGYATFYGIMSQQKKRANKTAFLSKNENLDDIFEKLSVPSIENPDGWWKWTNITFTTLGFYGRCCTYQDIVDQLKCDGKAILIAGFLHSFKHFASVFDEIKCEFTFKASVQETCRQLFLKQFSEIGIDRRTSVVVGMHLRRGDRIEFGHSAARADYVERVVRFHEKLYFAENTGLSINRNLVFFLIGDDYAWNNNIAALIEFSRPNSTRWILIDSESHTTSPGIDMCMMRFVDHVAISGGTYSWWCGFFSRGIVTYQKEYAIKNSSHHREYEPNDYFLPSWIPL